MPQIRTTAASLGMCPQTTERHRSDFPVRVTATVPHGREAGSSKHLSTHVSFSRISEQTVTVKSQQVPDGAAEFEPPDPRCGELPGVQVGDVLHGLLQLPDILSLQSQHRLAGVGFNLKSCQRERGEA